MRKHVISLLFALLVILSTGSFAEAWDGIVVGTIATIDVTAGNNYGFRIYFEGAPPMCNGQNWAYLLDTDSNYNAYLASMLTAKVSNLGVTVWVNQDSSGYCHIGYMSIH